MTLSIFIQSGELVIISSKILNWIKSIDLRSVKFQMLITYLIIGIIPLLFFSFNTTKTLQEYFEDNNEKEVLYQANKIAGNIQKADYLNDKSKQEQFWQDLDDKSVEENCRIIVVDKNGYAVADTNGVVTGRMFIVPEILVALAGRDEANLRKDEEAIYASAYIEDFNSNKIGAVLVVSSFSEVTALIGEISQKWIIVTFFIIIIVIALVIFMSQIIFGPLKNVLATIKKISAGQLHQRIEIKGKNEFTELGEAVNTMTKRLEEVDQSRQEFVSNVSHELKTPLSSIKVLSESLLLQENVPAEMYKEFLQDISSEIDRMTDIVNDLLALVRNDPNESKLNITDIDANKMLRDIVRRLSPLATDKEIDLSFQATKDVVLKGDEVKLSLAISNLVDNGIKYTPQGGIVKVLLDADNKDCFITVQDSGIGISEEEQSKVFERFYRVDKTRDRETGGTGLGLAITHSVIMLHNGSVKIISGENEGATFIVRLPLEGKEV